MDMINLREAPMVDKPVEGATLFALNPDGSIDRIKADGVGGGKVAVIKIDMSSIANTASLMSDIQNRNVANIGINAVADDGIEEDSGTSEVPCTCDTMTFEEAKAILLAGEKLDAVITAGINGQIISVYALGAWYQNTGNAEENPKSAAATEMITIFSLTLAADAVIQTIWTADGITISLY